jgi:hypothetical protein
MVTSPKGLRRSGARASAGLAFFAMVDTKIFILVLVAMAVPVAVLVVVLIVAIVSVDVFAHAVMTGVVDARVRVEFDAVTNTGKMEEVMVILRVSKPGRYGRSTMSVSSVRGS